MDAGKKRHDKDTSKGKKAYHDDDWDEEEEQEKPKSHIHNTYRLEPRTKVQDGLVRDKAQAILTNKLQGATYDGASSAFLCASISEEILKSVKELDYDRYKLPADASGMLKETLGFQLNVKLIHLLHWLW